MLPSARTNDAFCSGLLYVVLHFHSSFQPESGWCMLMKSMNTPKSAVWIVASGSLFFSFRRARARTSTTRGPGGAARAARLVGVVRAHPRVAQRHDARERAAASAPRRAASFVSSSGGEARAPSRGRGRCPSSRLERLADRQPPAAVDVRGELAPRDVSRMSAPAVVTSSTGPSTMRREPAARPWKLTIAATSGSVRSAASLWRGKASEESRPMSVVRCSGIHTVTTCGLPRMSRTGRRRLPQPASQISTASPTRDAAACCPRVGGPPRMRTRRARRFTPTTARWNLLSLEARAMHARRAKHRAASPQVPVPARCLRASKFLPVVADARCHSGHVDVGASRHHVRVQRCGEDHARRAGHIRPGAVEARGKPWMDTSPNAGGRAVSTPTKAYSSTL